MQTHLINVCLRDFREPNTEKMFFSDRVYNTITKKQIMLSLNSDYTDTYLYNPENYDCDDFSFILQGKMKEKHPGIPFGILWVNRKNKQPHALNCVYIFEEDKMYCIEPQTDHMFEIPDDWNLWLLII